MLKVRLTRLWAAASADCQLGFDLGDIWGSPNPDHSMASFSEAAGARSCLRAAPRQCQRGDERHPAKSSKELPKTSQRQQVGERTAKLGATFAGTAHVLQVPAAALRSPSPSCPCACGQVPRQSSSFVWAVLCVLRRTQALLFFFSSWVQFPCLVSE